MALAATSHPRQLLPANLRSSIQHGCSRAPHPCTSTSEMLAVEAVAGPRPRSIPHSARAADPDPPRFPPLEVFVRWPPEYVSPPSGAGIRKPSQTRKSRDVRFHAAVRGIADIKRALIRGTPIYEYTP